MGVIEKI